MGDVFHIQKGQALADGLDTDVVDQIDGRQIAGVDQGLPQRDEPFEVPFVVLGGPDLAFAVFVVLEGSRQVGKLAGGVVAHIQGCLVDEGFEGRTGLTPGHGHPVESAFAVIDTPHHRQNIPGVVLYGDQRAVEFGLFGILFVALDQAVKTVFDRLACRLLHLEIDGGVDLVTAGSYISQPALETTEDLIHDVGSHILGQGGVMDLGDLFDRPSILPLRDPPQILHPVEDGVGPVEGPFVVPARVVVAGSVGQPYQDGDLLEGQIPEGLVEIALGGGLDPVVVVAVGDLVEIAFDDLLFAQDILDLDGQDRLFDLSGQFLLAGEELVLDQLLGQGRSPLHETPRLEIGDDRPEDGVGVDPVVLEEAGVLRGDQRFDKLRRKLIEGGVETVALFENVGQMPAVAVQDLAGDLGTVVDDLLGVELHLLIGVDKSPHQCHEEEDGQKDGAFDKAIDHVRNSLLAKLASTRRRV